VAVFGLAVASPVPVTFAWDLDATHDGATFEVETDGTVQPCGNLTVTATDRRCTAQVTLGTHTFRLRGTNTGGVGAWSQPVTASIAAPGLFTITFKREQPTPPPPSLSVTPVTAWIAAASGTVTTPSLTVSAGDVLIAAVVADTDGTATVTTVSSTPAATWTKVVANGGAGMSNAEAWMAQPSAGAYTVSLTSSRPFARALQLYRVTGADLAKPVGATWTGASTANPWTPATYTSTSVNSWGLCVAADYSASGQPTSTDLIASGNLATPTTTLSWAALRKASPTAIIGTVVSFNVDSPGSGAVNWRAVALEIRAK
jgi:hypothetical protein